MSELKAYMVYTPREGVVEGLWKSYSIRIEGVEVYLKSEADKVIAENDAEIAQLQAMLEERNKQVGKLKEESRWRSVSEELPSHDTWCIAYHEGEIDVDHYTDDCNSHDRFVMYGDYVTHWMPLPKAPDDEEL